MADAHYNVGNIFYEKEQYAMAIAHYKSALEIRPNWEKARTALESAQAQQAPAEGAPRKEEAVPAKPAKKLDPNRQVDPNLHGTQLRDIHQHVTEMDAQGRKLADMLLNDVEATIKGLSNCLLFPDNPAYNLTEQLHKFDLVVGQLAKLQQSVQKKVQQIDHLTEQMAKI